MSNSQATSSLIVSAIQAFNDNYIWALANKNSNHLALIDPGDADVCIKYIEQNKLSLTTILITHHHQDHTGGIKALVEYYQKLDKEITVFGPKLSTNPCINQLVCEGDTVKVKGLELSLSVIDLPGHTLDHIAYYGQDNLFCGDTLFSGGCGRIFEGTAKQMFLSLEKLKSLPERTRVYCTHEYTLANLTFALTVDPSNKELVHYYNEVVTLRENNQNSLPSSIAREKKINPFLRCDNEHIQQSAKEYSEQPLSKPLDVFTIVRQWKDKF